MADKVIKWTNALSRQWVKDETTTPVTHTAFANEAKLFADTDVAAKVAILNANGSGNTYEGSNPPGFPVG